MYIAVDLKVIEGVANATARAAGVHEDRVLAGLVRLWHRCWTQTSDQVSVAQLAGLLGGDRITEVAAALVEHGFLEARDGGFRVRGAARYLRLKESRREGARRTNAARSKGARERRSRALVSDAGATLNDALSPSTEHRAPSTEPEKPATASRPPRESDLLIEDFASILGSPYAWAGAKDGASLAWLLKQAPLEEVRNRWRRGLRVTSGWLAVRTVAQLRQKWNDLAPQASGLGAFAQDSTSEGFG